MMDRETAIALLNNLRTFAEEDDEPAIDMAIEALSQPNYETDTEVRLAVTNRKKEKVILWDAYGEVEYYPIESLSAEQKEEDLAKDIARRMATIIENEQDMRIILKNASTELLKDGTLKVKTDNGAEVNRVLVWGDDGCGGLYYADDRPSGEWVEKEVVVDEDTNITEWQSAKCSVCGKYHTTPYMYYFDSFNYCPNCGAKMGGE